MSTEPLSHRIYHPADLSLFSFRPGDEGTAQLEIDQRSDGSERIVVQGGKTEFASRLRRYLAVRAEVELHPAWSELSSWSRSGAKRVFDCACVLLSLPVLVPLILVIAAAVRLTSRGPVFFLQQRVGWHGRTFTILKFRTMVHGSDTAHHPITTCNNQRFTPVGPILRRWKLDELPQLANVLLGQMSLIGPRPKLREHEVFHLPCRPGVTGLATIVFAREERILTCVARDRLDDYYHSVVLPAKRQLDAAYMARATFLSDLRLLMNSIFRRWETEALDDFILATAFGMEEQPIPADTFGPVSAGVRSPIVAGVHRQEEAEQIAAQ